MGEQDVKQLSISYWRRFFTEEWVPVLISLCAAVLVWYFVGGEDSVDTSIMVPVEVINLPRDLVISNQFKKEIEVTLNGPRSLINELQSRGIRRQIDLSQAAPGTSVITNEPESISVPRGVTVLRVQPASIILSIDKLIQKTFPINPVTAGVPRAGYILRGLRMDPAEITITGPITVLSQYEVLRTEVIDINGLDKNEERQVPLDLEPAFVDLIGQTKVTAQVQVELETSPREFTLPLNVQNQPWLPAEVRVIAAVPGTVADRYDNLAELFEARISWDEEGKRGVIQIVPLVELEYPLEIIQVDPEVVVRPEPPEAR
jgi:YbbR domain-containing protein